MFIGFYAVKVDKSNVPRVRKANAVISENMSVILTWVASGYTLKSIYKTLHRQEVLSCSYGNFIKYYYFFKKELGISKPQALAVGKPAPELKNSSTENVASMEAVPVTEKLQPKRRTNKAIIFENVPRIREWVALGYRIPSIYQALKAEGIITCGLDNFRGYYYQALKTKPRGLSTVSPVNGPSVEPAATADTVLNSDDDGQQPEASEVNPGQKLLVMVWEKNLL